jgi:hypothetical protein
MTSSSARGRHSHGAMRFPLENKWGIIRPPILFHIISSSARACQLRSAERGAAVVCAVGLGLLDSFQEAGSLITVERVYEPQRANKAIYDRNFEVYLQLYKSNRELFKELNNGQRSAVGDQLSV